MKNTLIFLVVILLIQNFVYAKDIKQDYDEVIVESFFENMDIASKCEYRFGLKHGYCYSYYIDGSLQRKDHYVYGVKEGGFTTYLEDGTIAGYGTYKNGMDDTFNAVDSDGNVIYTLIYGKDVLKGGRCPDGKEWSLYELNVYLKTNTTPCE